MVGTERQRPRRVVAPWLAFVISALPAYMIFWLSWWAPFMWSAWRQTGETVALVTAVLDVVLPFGYHPPFQLTWTGGYQPSPESATLGPLLILLPIVTLYGYSLLCGRSSRVDVRRTAWVWAAIIFASVVFLPTPDGALALWYPGAENPSPQAVGYVLGRALGRVAVVAPYVLGYVVWLCPRVVADLVGSSVASGADRRDPEASTSHPERPRLWGLLAAAALSLSGALEIWLLSPLLKLGAYSDGGSYAGLVRTLIMLWVVIFVATCGVVLGVKVVVRSLRPLPNTRDEGGGGRP